MCRWKSWYWTHREVSRWWQLKDVSAQLEKHNRLFSEVAHVSPQRTKCPSSLPEICTQSWSQLPLYVAGYPGLLSSVIWLVWCCVACFSLAWRSTESCSLQVRLPCKQYISPFGSCPAPCHCVAPESETSQEPPEAHLGRWLSPWRCVRDQGGLSSLADSSSSRQSPSAPFSTIFQALGAGKVKEWQMARNQSSTNCLPSLSQWVIVTHVSRHFKAGR